MITFEAVTFGYGKKPLFQGLGLTAEPGTTVGLLGLNGAGKTSLLKLAAGALFPGSGKVEVFGRESRSRSAAFLADVAFVPEDPWAPPLSPQAWLGRYGVFRPRLDRDRYFALLEEFQVDRAKPVAKMSYGQRKKFALSVAMACGSRTVLLDEPTNGLDIPSKAQFRRSLAMAASADRIFILSTHQARDLENMLDPIVIVHEGRVLCSFSAALAAERFSVKRLDSLDGAPEAAGAAGAAEAPGASAAASVRTASGVPVVYAEQDALGWTALVAESGTGADLELLFTAAVKAPDRFRAALEGTL